MDKLLPLGSVVLLHGGIMKIMVIGRLQLDKEDNQLYDYSGCAFPFGIGTDEKIFLFNNEDINITCFTGYKNEEEAEFQIVMNKFMESYGSSKDKPTE